MLQFSSVKTFFFILYSFFWSCLWLFAIWIDSSNFESDFDLILVPIPWNFMIFFLQIILPLYREPFLLNPLYDTETEFNSHLHKEMLDEWITLQQYEHKAITLLKKPSYWFEVIFNVEYAYLFLTMLPIYVFIIISFLYCFIPDFFAPDFWNDHAEFIICSFFIPFIEMDATDFHELEVLHEEDFFNEFDSPTYILRKFNTQFYQKFSSSGELNNINFYNILNNSKKVASKKIYKSHDLFWANALLLQSAVDFQQDIVKNSTTSRYSKFMALFSKSILRNFQVRTKKKDFRDNKVIFKGDFFNTFDQLQSNRNLFLYRFFFYFLRQKLKARSKRRGLSKKIKIAFDSFLAKPAGLSSLKPLFTNISSYNRFLFAFPFFKKKLKSNFYKKKRILFKKLKGFKLVKFQRKFFATHLEESNLKFFSILDKKLKSKKKIETQNNKKGKKKIKKELKKKIKKELKKKIKK